MSTLTLMCGLPGAGKTTVAKRIEEETGAVRLCPDEWIKAILTGPPEFRGDVRSELDRLRDPVERVQRRHAFDLLARNINVILENGFWSRAERLELVESAHRLGAETRLILLDPPLEVLLARLKDRNETASRSADSFQVSEADLVAWSKLFERPDQGELVRYDELEMR
ncbi:MAG: ATP-binding protein [Planctomycetota bacterium]